MLKTFIALILLPQLVGFISSIFTVSSIDSWYASLIKPSFNPPNYVFGPVWTILYLFMGISSYLVWINKSKHKNSAKRTYLLQLFINFIWSFVFFWFQKPLYALVVIAVLWVLILTMIVQFYKIDKRAGLLQIPYLLWVSFATVLNYYIFILN